MCMWSGAHNDYETEENLTVLAFSSAPGIVHAYDVLYVHELARQETRIHSPCNHNKTVRKGRMFDFKGLRQIKKT